MAQKRRIVLDNSVMVPAYFRETIVYKNGPFDLSKRAYPVAEAIRTRSVLTFAPEQLRIEFMKIAYEKASLRTGSKSVDMDQARDQVYDFLSLPITYVPGGKLDRLAWDLAVSHKIPPPDSWYLACAMSYNAELWISHDHIDKFAEKAREVYKNVRVLTREKFNS